MKLNFLAATFVTFSASAAMLSADTSDHYQELDSNLFSELHMDSFLTQREIEIIEVQENPLMKSIQFTPPTGWRFADTSSLPGSVKTLVVGKGNYEFPPSINLGMENYPGTLKQYLKRVKEINDNQGYTWKDLGKIRTKAGDASLSQVDTRTQWGEVKLMHVIFKDNGVIYILTAAAIKEEFPKFYKDFFNSMCSLHFTN